MTAPRNCSADGCTERHYAKGWCRGHYHRLVTHGDVLKGRTARGRAATFFSETVILYRGENCLIWPYTRNPKGYATMKSQRKTRLVSRLLCERINGPAPTPEHHAAHSCGNGRSGCVTSAHIMWKTPTENEADKILHGTHVKGAQHGNAKITEEIAKRIVADRATQREIASKYGVSQQQVSRIKTKKAWGWL